MINLELKIKKSELRRKLDIQNPDTASTIAQKLNTLEEVVDLDVVKGLKKIIGDFQNKIKVLTDRPINGGAVTGKGHIKTYDLSDKLDGVTTTFNLPANWTIISVVSSSFPSAFRPIIDYTFTPTSLTFTSQINPASTLAIGQTLIVIYEESA